MFNNINNNVYSVWNVTGKTEKNIENIINNPKWKRIKDVGPEVKLVTDSSIDYNQFNSK
jgi:hypothetical protein